MPNTEAVTWCGAPIPNSWLRLIDKPGESRARSIVLILAKALKLPVPPAKRGKVGRPRKTSKA